MINVLSIRYVKVYTMEDIFKKEMITPNPNFVKKFYFLDYFYILLKSVKMHSDENEILEEFKILKKKYLLGESKYKRLTADDEKLTKKDRKSVV